MELLVAVTLLVKLDVAVALLVPVTDDCKLDAVRSGDVPPA